MVPDIEVKGLRYFQRSPKPWKIFFDPGKATLNGTILCYAAARADLSLKKTPLFDQAYECAKKSLTKEQLIEVLKIPCDFVISGPDGNISYQENFVTDL